MSKFVLVAALISGAFAAPAVAQFVPPPYGMGQGWGPGEPIVRINQYDGGSVNLRNGCIATFNSYGTAISRTPRCTPRMVADAREIFRRTQLGGGYRRSWSGAAMRPQVGWWGNAVRVDFPGAQCSYVYSRSGEHLQTLGSQCSSQMRAIANDAQTAFRRGGRW